MVPIDKKTQIYIISAPVYMPHDSDKFCNESFIRTEHFDSLVSEENKTYFLQINYFKCFRGYVDGQRLTNLFLLFPVDCDKEKCAKFVIDGINKNKRNILGVIDDLVEIGYRIIITPYERKSDYFIRPPSNLLDTVSKPGTLERLFIFRPDSTVLSN